MTDSKKKSSEKKSAAKKQVAKKDAAKKAAAKKQPAAKKSAPKEQPVPHVDLANLPPLRIGIICNETNREDLLYYRDEFIRLNEIFAAQVQLVLFGYNGEDEDNNWLEGVNFEYVKPVSIVHYFKQLKTLNLDIVFIPLIKNTYNVTSENYNKYLESAVSLVPILTESIYPYNKMVQDKFNGFLYKGKHEFLPYVVHLYRERELIKVVASNAERDVLENFNYSEENIKSMSDLFI